MLWVAGGVAAAAIGYGVYRAYQAVQRNQAREELKSTEGADGGSLLPQ